MTNIDEKLALSTELEEASLEFRGIQQTLSVVSGAEGVDEKIGLSLSFLAEKLRSPIDAIDSVQSKVFDAEYASIEPWNASEA